MARFLFTSRIGGESVAPFSEFNLAKHVGDNVQFVNRNRLHLEQEFSAPVKFMQQTHGNVLSQVSSSTIDEPEADAIFTTEKGLGLAVLVADCIPLLLHSDEVVAAVHVGRKGLLNKIVEATVSHLQQLSNSRIVAEIGPSICGRCYEVSEEIYLEVVEQVPATATDYPSFNLDLVAGCIDQLSSLDVAVNSWHRCTREDEMYFSYRSAQVTGRQVGVIAL